jgi:prolyl oligopeptidase
MLIDERPTISAPDDDPYLWLEEIEGSRALAFVDAQNAATLARFNHAGLTADRDALAAIYDQPDNIPIVARRGSDLYNFWKDANNPRGLWRRTTLDSFRSQRPQWEIVLDLDELAAREAEDWIWNGSSTLPRVHDRAILGLSRGGGDAVVLREFDIATKAFVPGGFHLPEAKGGAEWVDKDTLLLSSALGDGMATASGYARTVRLWQRGVDVARASTLFETTPDSMSAWASVDRTQGTERVWFVERPAFFDMIA